MKPADQTVLVFGTFDILHPGHRWFLRRAARHGTRLVAAVSRDSFVREWKGQSPVASQDDRIAALEESGLVNSAVLSDADIRTYGVVGTVDPDVICLGHDQGALKDDLESWLESQAAGGRRPRVVILPPWHRRIYSSTRLNRSLRGAVGASGDAASVALYAIMILAMGTFGFSWVSGKRMAAAAGPGVLSFLRFALTAFCFIPPMLIRRPEKVIRSSALRGWGWTLSGAVAICAYNLLFFSGLEAGLAGQGGLIVTTLNPLFTFLIVSAAGRHRPGKWAMAGIAAGIAGGLLLLEPWKYDAAALLDSGNLAFLAGAVMWSVLTVTGRRAQAHLGFRRFNLGLYGLAALLALPFAAAETGGALPSGLDAAFWGDMVFISAAVGAFGTGAYFMASARLGAARGSAFTYLVPVFALLFTALVLGERPEPAMIVGGTLAVAAVMLVNRRGRTVGS